MFWNRDSKAKINTDPQKIEELLTRGVEEVFVRDHLKAELLSGRQLRIKFGIDPTSPSIHLGRAVVLRKLRDFQDLGHKIVLIIGDFTAKIGDPSDKLEKRPMLTDNEIKKNLAGYLNQIGKIINVKNAEIHYNSEWLSSMNYIETAKLLESFTVQQMSKRRNFKERLDLGQDIFIVEFLYPALQGYDSFKVSADVEIGGFDQLFNLQAGRTVQKKYGQKEQDIMTVSMLLGTDGRKMSSSWGNVISLLDAKDDMFGKIMSVRDDLIIVYFTLCTDVPSQVIEIFKKDMESGVNPKDVKMKLAYEIVRIYHGDDSAKKAQENFEKTFSKGEIPVDILEVKSSPELFLADVFLQHGIVESKTEFRRLVTQGSITNLNTGEKVGDNRTAQAVSGTYRIGSKRFIKLIN